MRQYFTSLSVVQRTKLVLSKGVDEVKFYKSISGFKELNLC